MENNRIKKIVSIVIYVLLIPIIVVYGYFIFKNKNYNLISLTICVIALIPFFLHFERNKTSARELVIIGVLVGLSTVGRIVFGGIPGFKPITAFVIIAGVAFGGEAGFIVGALSAFLSNMFFGQGTWTPFQMFTWGLIGFISGFFKLKDTKFNLILLLIIGVLGGIAYSLLMDFYTTISVDHAFSFSRYLFFVSNSFLFMGIYAISNVVFLLILYYPLTSKLKRIKDKYLVFSFH